MLGRSLLFAFRIDLQSDQLPSAVLGGAFQDRSRDAARTTPRGPKIDEYGNGGLCDRALELAAVHRSRSAAGIEPCLAIPADGDSASGRLRDAIERAAALAAVGRGHVPPTCVRYRCRESYRAGFFSFYFFCGG